MKHKNIVISLATIFIILSMKSAFSFDLVNSLFSGAVNKFVSNRCGADADKRPFSCAKPEQIAERIQDNKDKSYTQFIKGIIQEESSIGKFITYSDASDSGYIQINWVSSPKEEDFNFFAGRSIEWFDAFCNAKNGASKAKKNKNICLPKDGDNPMFGMTIDYGIYPSKDSFSRPYYTRVIIFGDTADVKNLMGIGKEFAVGDQTTLGMVIEVKPPLAKIQIEVDGKSSEKWVKIDDLESKK